MTLSESPENKQIYAIGIEFIGTAYRGWQRQQTARSIQETVETALGRIANEQIEVVAAGRTDAGVHAGNMVAHFCSNAQRTTSNWLRGANTLLPDGIALRWLVPMPTGFHARFKAVARRYRYVILNQPYRPAILRHQVTWVREPLDVQAMQVAAKTLVGTHDFTSFRAAACQSRQPVRQVSHAFFVERGSYLVFDIQADGFLHHMVRNLMGTLIAIGQGELTPADMSRLLMLKDRTAAPATASADGLYFVNAYYPEEFQRLLPNLALTPHWLNMPD